MRIGIFSDVHSNLEALQVGLKYLSEQKVEQYLFIGDLVGYSANPNECVELVKELKCILIAGNHDYGVLEKTILNDFNDAAKTAIIWTKEQINQKSKEFLSNLPLTNNFQDCLLVHATPKNPLKWQYLFNLNQVQKEFLFYQEKICFVGHSHYPIIFEYREQENKVTIINEGKFKIKGSGYRYLINVGSVGQPRDGDFRTCVVLFDSGTNHIEFKRLEYDIELAKKKIIKAGLPEILARRLSEGK